MEELKVDKWEMYMEIHQLLKQGFSKSKISKKLGISRTTIYRYLKRDVGEMADWVQEIQSRSKLLDPHKTLILSWLREHPDMSSAQVLDWLQEKYKDDIKVAESTVRRYVRELREDYDIPKVASARSYEAIPEVPMGEQTQVDFGQTHQYTPDGKLVKLRFIAFVVANSRFKYKEWLDRPFTTRDVIRAHENAFQYFGGIPNELVYDQDALIVVSENAGDLILTREFQSYREERHLTLRVCRPFDPESKGKIENVVGYIKNNFAKHRVYYGLDAWNESGWDWLERTGNYKIHNTTKKRPVEVFALEKQHLRPISRSLNNSIQDIESSGSSITRTVRKDNTIWHSSNRYSVPLGTFNKTKEVYIEIIDDLNLLIRETINGPVIASHQLIEGKGKLVQATQHRRDRSKGIDAYLETVAYKFSQSEQARLYLSEIRKTHPRYIRDQLQRISKSFKDHEVALLDEALAACMERQLFSATDFIDMVQYLHRYRSGTVTNKTADSSKSANTNQSNLISQTQPQIRDIREYVAVLEGDVQ